MKIHKDHSLKNYNTFGFEVKAKFFVEINSVAGFKKIYLDSELNKFIPNNLLILGGGSNLLLTQDFDGLVILNKISGIEVQEDSKNSNSIKISAGAGENWHDLVMFTVKNGFYGMQNMALIPGSVGASPMQNIGAYGSESKDVIESVEAINLETLQEKTFENEECEFGYRSSIFKTHQKGKWLITGVNFILQKKLELNISYRALKNYFEEKNLEPKSPKEVAEAVIEIRRSKLPDPAKIGNSGSFFKNPVIPKKHFQEIQAKYPEAPSFVVSESEIKIPAAWLIQTLGFKGFRDGQIGVNELQPLVLVNFGGGTGQQILALAQKIQKEVLEEFKIDLEMEVNVI